MADPWEPKPKPADLPDPELNPLMNPTLGKNLGRWAQVYFTAPPETRAEAVVNLLRELDGEKKKLDVTNNNETQDYQPLVGSVKRDVMFCPQCGEAHPREQKFCGICGTRVEAPQPRSEARAERELEQAAGESASIPRSAYFAPAEPAPAAKADDVDWLRERNFSLTSEPEESTRKTWIFAGLALIVALAIVGYFRFAPKPQSAASPESTLSTTDGNAAQLADAEAPPKVNPPTGKATEPARVASVKTPDAPAAKARVKKTAPAASDEESTASAAAPENGSSEVAEAQRQLAARNPEVAARLLWNSVRKENAGAELMLADLYARGEGVGKNCEQARLLLVAAAKKGVGEAAQKLRNFQSTGCQ